MPWTPCGKALLDRIYPADLERRTQNNGKPVEPVTSEPCWDGRAQVKESV